MKKKMIDMEIDEKCDLMLRQIDAVERQLGVLKQSVNVLRYSGV